MVLSMATVANSREYNRYIKITIKINWMRWHSSMNHLITVVVPCFNEEDVIQTAHQRLVHMMTQNKYSQYE